VKDENLKKAEQIAKDTQKKIDDAAVKASESEKKDTESKAAVETEKGKGEKSIVEKAEKQAEDDAKILTTKDEEPSEDDKKKKEELVKKKSEKEEPEESPEDKIKREAQKRIDRVIGEIKALKAESQQDKEKIAGLQEKLETLTKPKEKEDKATIVKNLVKQQKTKFLEEDSNKPREQKREMTKEELDEWLLEDFSEALSWQNNRDYRRNKDKERIVSDLDNAPKKLADEFVAKQQESLKKLVTRFPNVMPSKEKLESLKGKSEEEKHTILSAENEDYAMAIEIATSNSKKYMESADGPEQVMIEMERRKGDSGKRITLTQEELEQKIKEASAAEVQRLTNLDEGITSSGAGRKVENKENKSELKLKQEEIARKAGVSIEDLDSAIKRRETIPGATAGVGSKEFNED